MDTLKKLNALLFITLILTSCGTSSDVKKAENAGSSQPFSVTCFDAGKGDAFLVSSKEHDILIDCGYKKDADEILEELNDLPSGKLDLLIISHFDKDHVGGASKIIKNYPVERIITSPQTNSDKRTEKFFEAMESKGLKNEVPQSDINIDKGDLKIMINPPEKTDYPDSDDNNSSLIVKISSSCGSMLFTGDAEDYRLSEVIDRSDLDCDVLKIPAHGREFDSIEKLIDATTPEYAVITSSDEEPSSESVRSALTENSVEFFDTRDDGSYKLVFDKDGISKVNLNR